MGCVGGGGGVRGDCSGSRWAVLGGGCSGLRWAVLGGGL